METAIQWKNLALESLTAIWENLVTVLPNIIGAILILLAGWIITRVIVFVLRKTLKLARANRLDDMLNDIEILQGKAAKFNIIKIVTGFVKWVLYIAFLIMALDVLNLTEISGKISQFLGYLPQLFAAVVIFTLGLLAANFIKKTLYTFFESMDFSGARIISQMAFLVILAFVSITALNQAGVDTYIITNNITLILGAFLLTFALAFGLGAREVVGDLLRAFYTRKTYEIGQHVTFKNIEGQIETINSTSLTLKIAEGDKIIIPIKDIVENPIRVQE